MIAWFENPRRLATAYPPGLQAIQSHAALAEARRVIAGWPGYAPTPLHSLDIMAQTEGLAAIRYKDEAGRFALGSFKALGGAYAVWRLLQKQGPGGQRITVTCATDGNHGRSVAWGAQNFGCACVIYVHATVSQGRVDAIARYGAEVRRVAGNYDDAVRQAQRDADANGWFVVSDTSYPGYRDVPRDVMQGYGVMAAEAYEQMMPAEYPTHVFVQGGVGGLAAAVLAYLWQRFGAERPRFVVVEPERAACLYESARAGQPVVVSGDLDTVMAGLACGEVSELAWELLDPGADGFMTVPDEAALGLMRRLADWGVVAGESAVAGLAGALAARQAGLFGVNAASRLLVFGSEGATDPALYRQIVGRGHEEVTT